MDKNTLDSLKSALSATPDNFELFMIVVKGCQSLGDHEDGYRLLKEKTFDLENPDDQLVAGEICLEVKDYKLALDLCPSETPACQMVRARSFLELGRKAEGLDCYKKAIEGNPALEDKNLENRLTGKITERTVYSNDSKVKLKVISNDDTDRTEITRLLMPENERVTFADVGGLETIKNQIHKKIILPFKKPSIFRKFKKRVGGGILLYGPPGCGKTLLARATAGECQARFFNVAISDILDMYIGESERKLHAIFENARQDGPSVVFFDEIEAIGGKRQYTREGTSSKLVSQFLSEMDGFANNNKDVLILGATNVPWAIDPAFRRPGRFDRVLFVPPPDREARKRILEIHLEGRPADGMDLDYFSRQTSGYSGADIYNIIETASDYAIEASLENEKEIPLNKEFMSSALKEVKPTTMDWLTTARNYARYANESGQYNEVLDFLKTFGKN
ncbi:MAG: ATP-binding protein [Deltaproteobacteria bacterium]|nr:ATP-binding protein [Deltaproteobacteria bacterium]